MKSSSCEYRPDSIRSGASSSGDEVEFARAVRFWLKLGFISFGGPAGQIAIMHRELVERRRWIEEDRFLHALNYCMLLPGPEAQQLATYVGWLLHGVRGGLAAGALFVAPSVLVLLALSYLYVAHSDSALVFGALHGFRAVAVAIVAEAVWRIGRRAIRGRLELLASVAAFVLIHFVGTPFPLIVLGAGLSGWLIWGVTSRSSQPSFRGVQDGGSRQKAESSLPSSRRALGVVTIGAVIWLAGMAAVAIGRGFDTVHAGEYWFFTKAAFVTFGGAYAVLAYLAQSVAGPNGWLTHRQIVDGLALAETTPGPLIMVVQFVGFVAAWNHPQGMAPLTSAIIGALIATGTTFLPSFLFIFLGAPYIEALRAHRRLAYSLRFVTAAVVGVVLNLALLLGTAVLLPDPSAAPDWLAAAIAGLALVGLSKLRLEILWVVIGGGTVGVAGVLFGG